MEKIFNVQRPKKKSDCIKPMSHYVRNDVLIGDWKEVQGLQAQTINAQLAAEDLDGIIIKGYEMRFADGKNWNGEVYEQTAYDDFIKSYFVEQKLNMTVDVEHGGSWDWRNVCGRVLYCEVNTVGLYFVIYVPKTYADYDRVLWGLKNGIIQGFSKEGYVDWEDTEYIFKTDGTFDYELIKRVKITRVSLVTMPANGLPFEKMQETRKDALVFESKNKDKADTLEAMFNN